MDRDDFWRVVETGRSEAGANDDAFLAHVTDQLRGLPVEEIASFEQIQDDLLDHAYRNDLWAAAYIINGGCSDDGFLYFRAWLVSRGRSVYESALADPASLEDAIVLDPAWDAELESFLYVARQLYESRTGTDMPRRDKPFPRLTGPDWEEESVDDMYPGLAAKTELRFGK